MLSFVVHRHFCVHGQPWDMATQSCTLPSLYLRIQSFLRKRNLIVVKVCCFELNDNDIDSYSEEHMAYGLQIRHLAEDFRIK